MKWNLCQCHQSGASGSCNSQLSSVCHCHRIHTLHMCIHMTDFPRGRGGEARNATNVNCRNVERSTWSVHTYIYTCVCKCVYNRRSWLYLEESALNWADFKHKLTARSTGGQRRWSRCSNEILLKFIMFYLNPKPKNVRQVRWVGGGILAYLYASCVPHTVKISEISETSEQFRGRVNKRGANLVAWNGLHARREKFHMP